MSDIEDSPKLVAVYKLFNSNGELIYVGKSVDLRERFSQHKNNSSWWGEVAEKTALYFDTEWEALAVEAELIQKESPKYNKSPGYGQHISTPKGAFKDYHRDSPMTFRAPSEMRSWLQDYSKAIERSVASIIIDALIEYRRKVES
jgi:predicted GIY-YIG superfamily endonuclease